MNTRTVPSAVLAGANIRRIRDDAGISLSGLARRSGVAKATLSALESGSSNPTVATLEAVADALDIPIGQLLVGGVDERRVVRATDATDGGTDDCLLESFAARGLIEIFDIRYEAGTRLDYEAHEPGLVERVLVHEGRLRVGPIDDPVDLDPGDYCAFPADRPHVYEGLDGPVRAVLVAVHPGGARGPEPIHPRSRH